VAFLGACGIHELARAPKSLLSYSITTTMKRTRDDEPIVRCFLDLPKKISLRVFYPSLVREAICFWLQ